MGKLFFKYGTMGSSKSADALMVKHRYDTIGKKCLFCKTRTDSRDGARVVKSRIGIKADNVLFLDEVLRLSADEVKEYDVIICDESQFASKEQIDALSDICDTYDIPVICYGLLSDFRGEMFEGSQRLFVLADKKEEVKQICWCGCKAGFNARIIDGEMVTEGEQIVLGGDESYIPLCRKHYKAKMIAPPTASINLANPMIRIPLNNDMTRVIEQRGSEFISYTLMGTGDDIDYNDVVDEEFVVNSQDLLYTSLPKDEKMVCLDDVETSKLFEEWCKREAQFRINEFFSNHESIPFKPVDYINFLKDHTEDIADIIRSAINNCSSLYEEIDIEIEKYLDGLSSEG